MRQLFTTAFILAGFTIILSCNKDEDKTATPTPSTPDYKALLKHDWKLAALNASIPIDWNDDGILETDLYTATPACEQDNIFSFTTDSSYAVLEGDTKCNANDPNTVYTAGWSVNYPILTLLDDQEHVIEQLDEHTLIFSLSAENGQGVQKLTWTLQR